MDEINFTLFETFIHESMILFFAFPSRHTCCGESWINCYRKSFGFFSSCFILLSTFIHACLFRSKNSMLQSGFGNIGEHLQCCRLSNNKKSITKVRIVLFQESIVTHFLGDDLVLIRKWLIILVWCNSCNKMFAVS